METNDFKLKNKVRQQLADMFIAALKEDTLPWMACWGRQNPINASTGKPYRGVNLLMLSYLAEKNSYADFRWMTFKQAQDKGWQIMKGAKAVWVEYWAYWDKSRKKLLNWDEAKSIRVLDPERFKRDLILSSRCYAVFNGEQVSGIPALEMHSKSTDFSRLIQSREILIRNMGVSFREGGDQAYYSPSYDCVTLPPVDDFYNEYGYLCTMLHEFGHASGHPSRLNRDLRGGFGSQEYAREELRAEIASAMVSQCLNLELDTTALKDHLDQHKAYVQAWIEVLEKSPLELFAAIKDANNISDYLLEKGELLSAEREANFENEEALLETGADLEEEDELEF